MIACQRATQEYTKIQEQLQSGELKEEDQKVEWNDAALEIFEKGIEFELADYPENDHDLVVAYNVLIHDESSVTWKKTTIGDLVRAAEAQRKNPAHYRLVCSAGGRPTCAAPVV